MARYAMVDILSLCYVVEEQTFFGALVGSTYVTMTVTEPYTTIGYG